MLVADSDPILKASAGHGPATSQSGKSSTLAVTVGRRRVSSTKNGVSDFMARARLVEDRLQELGALYQMARFLGRTFFEESSPFPVVPVLSSCSGDVTLHRRNDAADRGGRRDSRSVVECVGQALAHWTSA